MMLLLFNLGSSKVEVSKTYIFGIVTTLDDPATYIEHVLSIVCVFFTLFGYWLRGEGRIYQGTRIQPAYAVCQCGGLKNGSFSILCFLIF